MGFGSAAEGGTVAPRSGCSRGLSRPVSGPGSLILPPAHGPTSQPQPVPRKTAEAQGWGCGTGWATRPCPDRPLWGAATSPESPVPCQLWSPYTDRKCDAGFFVVVVFWVFFYLYWESRVSRLSHLNCSLGNDSFWELFESEALHSDICGNPHRLASKQAWGKLRAPSFTLGEHFRQAACGIKHVQCL